MPEDVEMKSPEAKIPRRSKSKKLVEEFDKDIISKIPDLGIAQLYFHFKSVAKSAGQKTEKWLALLKHIRDNEMGPFYEFVCQDSGTPLDQGLIKTLHEKNTARLREIDEEIEDAEKNLGESDVRAAWLRKSEYLCQIGDKDAAVTAFRNTYEKTVGIGYRIDLVFNLIRLGLFFLDHQLISSNIAKAKSLMEQGGDWDRKNRLRSYEGLYKMAVRDMSGAAELFLEAVPTFGSYELMRYEDLVFYAIVTSTLALERPDLREKVIKCNEIQEQLNGGGENGELVLPKEYLESFYECRYDDFFKKLAKVIDSRFKQDRFLEPHQSFYAKEMRVKAYCQFLAPYKTVRLQMMARDFGVSTDFIDKELHSQIAAGTLNCRIDGVNGVVEINHPDTKNHLYKTVIRDGDILLNRVQNLARMLT